MTQLSDVEQCLGLAWLVHRLMGWSLGVSLAAMFALGVICHRLFCVPTTIDRLFFAA